MHRAHSLLTLKSVDEEKRVLTGIATTPSVDRSGDIVEPDGAEFALPIPFLWQHDSRKPVGSVTKAKVTPAGIEVEIQVQRTDEPGEVKNRLDSAWQDIKLGLVRGLSIGFKELEYARIENTYSYRYLRWLWLELSAVTIAANGDCSIQTIKSIDRQLWAASGRKELPVVRLDPPGASGTSTKTKSIPAPKEGKDMSKLAEQITAFEAELQAKKDKLATIQQKALDEGRTKDASEKEEFDTIKGEIAAIEDELKDLRELEKAQAAQAKAVGDVRNQRDAGTVRTGSTVQVKTQPKLAPGIGFARLAKVKALSKMDHRDPLQIAKERYGESSEIVGVVKAAVEAGSNVSGNWAADLVSAEGGIVADFAEFLRPATILGKFGQNGVPALRGIPFRVPVVIQTGGGSGYWVGEGKPKPLTKFDFDRTTMDPLKVANITVLTMESIRDSSPSSEVIVRDSLRDALAARLDIDFINPAKTASSGVSPASITNGAASIAAIGTDADAVRLQVRALFAKFIAANNAPTSGVWIMSSSTALALSLMVNALGQEEFPGLSMTGGTFMGLPTIISEYVGTIVALVNASDIYLADEGGVSVDMSTEASLEMLDGSLTQDALAGTGASLVSMFQTNSVALRAERTINWKRRRPSAVAYLTGVNWGGAVPNS